MNKIEEKVEQRLQEAQANKEFKDIGRVSNLKKTKAAYRLIDMSNLSEIEMDEVQAFNIVKKDLVWQPIDVNAERDKGTTAGATFLKIELRKAVPAKPDNNKNKRASYVLFLNKLQADLSECYNVKQIEELAIRYRKLAFADIVSYLLDPTYAEKSQEDKNAIDEMVKKNYRMAMIYGSERLMSQVIEEVFSKRFANMLFDKGDTAYATYKEAKDKEPITQEQSIDLIANLEKRKEMFISSNRTNQEEYKNYTIPQLKNAMDTKWQLSPMSKAAYKENIENFRTWAIDYYERQIKRGSLEYDTKIELAKPKGNDWSWADVKKEKSEKKSSENKLIINKKEPLAYIKRTGGYKIGEVSEKVLIDKFGYKAVNYGNYVDDKWSKQHTKFYLQAMSDLGEIFNINIKELNELGGLGIVFGGKGHAGHLAAYYPQTKDINLTKSNGDGSVGHEYGHYFDNLMVDLDKKKAEPRLATEHLDSIENYEVKLAFTNIVDFFKKGNPLYTPKMKVRFFAQPSDYAPKIPYIKDRRWERKPIEFKPTIEETLEQCNELLVFDENLYQTQVAVIGYIINHFDLSEYEVEITLKTSMFFQKSKFNFFTYCFKQPAKNNPNRIEIVKAGNLRTPYWISSVELFARAWETILLKKILEKNRRSDYLVSGIDLTDLNVEGFQNPYPSGSELDYLESLYDKLIATVKKAFNLSDFVPYNTEREDTLVEFESKTKPEIKVGIDVTKGKKAEVVEYIKDNNVVETASESVSPELQKGIEVEQEHKETLNKVASGEITPTEAIKEIAITQMEDKIYSNIKECLLADGDNENDYIVEGTKIFNNEGSEEWHVIGFYKTGIVLKHSPKSKLSNEKGTKEISFDEIKNMFFKHHISIVGINGGDTARLNVCIKAIVSCMDKIDTDAYKTNLEKEVEKIKKESAESPSKVDMSEFYKIVRESNDFEEAFKKAQLIKGVTPETSKYFYSKYNPTGVKSGKETFKSFYEEVRGTEMPKVETPKIEPKVEIMPNKPIFEFMKSNPMQQARAITSLEKLIRADGKVVKIHEWIENFDKGLEIGMSKLGSSKSEKGYVEKPTIGNHIMFTKAEQEYYKYLENGGENYTSYLNKKKEYDAILKKKADEERAIKDKERELENEKREQAMQVAKDNEIKNFIENGKEANLKRFLSKWENEIENLKTQRQSENRDSQIAFAERMIQQTKEQVDKSYKIATELYKIVDGKVVKKYDWKVGDKVLYGDKIETTILEVREPFVLSKEISYKVEKEEGIYNQYIGYDGIFPIKKEESPKVQTKAETKTEFEEAIEMITELLPDLKGEQKQEALDAIEMIKELQ
jgi:hypothetical protein